MVARREFIGFMGMMLVANIAGAAWAKGRKPIAIAATGRGAKRTVVRLYAGDKPGTFLAMARRGKKEWFYDLRAGAKDLKMIGAAAETGKMQARIAGRKVSLRLKREGNGGMASYQADDGSSGDIQTQMDPVTATVIIFGMVTLLGIVAIIAGSGGGKVSVDTPAGSADVEVNGKDGKEKKGIVAAPECDGPPILLC